MQTSDLHIVWEEILKDFGEEALSLQEKDKKKGPEEARTSREIKLS